MKLWYKEPAKCWDEALPIGNGRLGAMVFGEPQVDYYQLNEESMWYGKPIDRLNPDSLAHLEEVRTLLLAGYIPEAEELLKHTFSGTPQSQRPYQSLGDLNLYHAIEDYDTYTRTLDLSEGIHTTRFKSKGVVYTRETFTSLKDGCMVIRLTADQPGSISFEANLTRERFYDHAWAVDAATIAIDGRSKSVV